VNLEVDENNRFMLIQDNGDGTSTVTRYVPGLGMTKDVFLAPLGKLPTDPITQEEVDRLKEIQVKIPDEPE
jgi:hypothetical protein